MIRSSILSSVIVTELELSDPPVNVRAAFRGANNVVEYLVEQGADLDARTELGYSPLAVADGFSYSDFYKAQKHTAALLRGLMDARGIPGTGEGHAIPGSLCYDCLQTRGDQIADRVRWEAELEAEFNARPRP